MSKKGINMKDKFGYWLCCWAWLFGMIISILTFTAFDGCKWGYMLMDWLDNHGFEMWVSTEVLKKKLKKGE